MKIKSKQIKDLSTSVTSTINSTSIDALSDVDVATKSTGQVLSWNGTNWVAANASGGSGSRITPTTVSAGFPYTISSPATSVVTLEYYINNGASNVVVNLPSASGDNAYLKIEIKRLGTGTVTVTPVASPQEYIDDLTSVILNSQYANLIICSDGTQWRIK